MKFILFIALILFSFDASACMVRLTLENELPRYKIVFFGEAITTCNPIQTSQKISFKVKKVWKGDVSEAVTYMAPCKDVVFQSKNKYLVFVKINDEQQLSVGEEKANLCYPAVTTQIIKPMLQRNLETSFQLASMGFYEAAFLQLFSSSSVLDDLGDPIKIYK